MKPAGGEELAPGSSLLMILMGSLGDVTRGLALVTPLRRRLPNSRITWLVEPKWESLVRLHPAIDEVIVFRRGMGIESLQALWADLRSRHFDVTLDLQRHFKSGLFSWFSGAPRRLGFHWRDSKEGNWVFNNEHIPYRGEKISKVDHYFEFLEYLGIACDRSVRAEGVRFLKAALEKSGKHDERLPAIDRPYLGVVLGSSRPSKDWTAEGYLGLVERLLKMNRYSVVLLGDRSHAKRAEMIMERSGSNRIVNLVARTDLLQLMEVLHGATLCVGPDSGPGHLSSALGVPYVSLFGPTAPERVAPYGFEQLVIRSSIACSPCERRECPGLDRLCMRLIGVDAVSEKIEEVLSG